MKNFYRNPVTDRLFVSPLRKLFLLGIGVALGHSATAFGQNALPEPDQSSQAHSTGAKKTEQTFDDTSERSDHLDTIIHNAVMEERLPTYLPHTRVIHHLNLPRHAKPEAIAGRTAPFFGSYRIPADNTYHGFKMQEVADIDVTALYTGGRDGVVRVEIHDARGKKLIKESISQLWKFDVLNQITRENLSFTRPRTGSTVLFKIGIEEIAPHRYIQFGLYRPDQVICGHGPLSEATNGYSPKKDLSRMNYHQTRADVSYPSTMMSPYKGLLMSLTNILDMRTDKEVEEEALKARTIGGNKHVAPNISGPSMKWGNERFEIFRWTWNAGRYDRTWPEWGYVAFDHKTHTWTRLCAFQIKRDDVRPVAWLFPGGLFAVTNGFCSDMRIYRLTNHRGAQSFRLPVDDIRGHMTKIARLFTNRGSRQEHPRVKPVAEAILAVTNIKTAGPFHEDLDISCEIQTEKGNVYDAVYTVRNGRLIGTSATKRDDAVKPGRVE